jgi:hypothetical protein
MVLTNGEKHLDIEEFQSKVTFGLLDYGEMVNLVI